MPLTVTVDLEHIYVFLRKTDRADQSTSLGDLLFGLKANNKNPWKTI